MSFDHLLRTLIYRGIFPALFPKPRPVPFAEMRSMLIIRADAIGDMICTTPLIHALHRRNPEMKIVVAASDRNADVIACDPSVYRVVTLLERGRLRRGAIAELRAMHFDAVLQCVTNSTTKFGALARYVAPHAITAALNHPERPEYGKLFSHLVDVPDMFTRPYAEIMMEFGKQVFNLEFSDEEYSPKIFIEHAVEILADNFFADHQLQRGVPLMLNLSAAQPRKRWPSERYDQLLSLLEARGYKVLLTAVPADHDLAQSLQCDHNARLFPAPNIRFIAAAASRCAMVITPDTAVVHVASATHTPVVALYSEFESVVSQWLPYRVPYRAVRTKEFSVASIFAEEVFAAVNDLALEIKP